MQPAINTPIGYLPAYPATVDQEMDKLVAYGVDGQHIVAYTEKGELWRHRTASALPRGELSGFPDLGLFGGFDINADGWPDVAVTESCPAGMRCGAHPMLRTRLDILDGRTGQPIMKTREATDKCWHFPEAVYPTHQWTIHSLLFGAQPGVAALLQNYASQGRFVGAVTEREQGVKWTFHYPSSRMFSGTYPAARPQWWDATRKHVPNSNRANGLLVSIAGQERLVFFTSGRVLQYLFSPNSAEQLLYDLPFVSGERKDLAGRNYGLIARDPGADDLLIGVFGTSIYSLYADLRRGNRDFDEWGGIERHVSIYNLRKNAIDDRFFSYAHDDNNRFRYKERIAYPANVFIKTAPGMPSRIAYNRFDGDRWWLHVSEPGSTKDILVVPDWILWDVVNLETNPDSMLLTSPVVGSGSAYFPQWSISLMVLEQGNVNPLRVKKKVQGVLPYLQPVFRRTEVTTSAGYLYPALFVRSNNQRLLLLVIDRAGRTALKDLTFE